MYSAVSPLEGTLDWRICWEMNTPRMGEFLHHMSQIHGRDFLLMILDGASSDKAHELEVPENLRLISFPPYPPKFDPQEHIGDEHLDKGVPNRMFECLDAVVHQLKSGLTCLAASTQRHEA